MKFAGAGPRLRRDFTIRVEDDGTSIGPQHLLSALDFLGGALAQRTRDEWTAVFDGVDACVTPVVELGETLEEPHLSARGTYVVVDGVQQAAPAPRFSRTPAAAPTAPGVPGSALDAVRADWGLPDR